jgi:uncharacterized protein YutE (UPF0331/DUF86 family)
MRHVAQHICATEGWGPPADNGDAVRLLGEHGVLQQGLARSIRQAVGFRNVLVHDYIRVNDDIVIGRLPRRPRQLRHPGRSLRHPALT